MFETTNQSWNIQTIYIYIYVALYGTNVPPFSDPEIPIKKYANILSI